MAVTCAKISADVLLDCDNPMLGGANDRLILVNKDDIASVTYNMTNPLIVENITLATGMEGYEYQGKNNSVEPRSALVKLRYAEVYEHEVIFKVFVNDADTKKQLELMRQSRLIAVIENNHKGDGGDAAFEVYGLESGLELVEMERVVADTETQGAYNLVLRSSENSRESHLPNTYFITDYATTKTDVETLLVPAP